MEAAGHRRIWKWIFLGAGVFAVLIFVRPQRKTKTLVDTGKVVQPATAVRRDFAPGERESSVASTVDVVPARKVGVNMGGGVSLEDLKTLASAKARNGVSVRLPFLLRNARLDPAFITFFGLTSDQVGTLQAAVDRAFSRLDDESLVNASVSLVSGDTIEIAVKPFGGGAAIFEELMAGFDRCLGSERAAVFMKMEQMAVDETFRNYGAETRLLRVTRTRISPPAFRVTEETESLTIMSESSPQHFTSVSQMQSEFGKVVTLLPPEFTR